MVIMTTTTIVERLSHLTLLRAASAIHACTLPIFLYRPTGEAGGVFDAAHTFLGRYRTRTRTHTPRLAGVGIFLLWLTSPTNEILVGISDFFSLRAHDSH